MGDKTTYENSSTVGVDSGLIAPVLSNEGVVEKPLLHSLLTRKHINERNMKKPTNECWSFSEKKIMNTQCNSPSEEKVPQNNHQSTQEISIRDVPSTKNLTKSQRKDLQYLPGDIRQSQSRRLPKCGLCQNHGEQSRVKNHKRYCPWRACTCAKCNVTYLRRKVTASNVSLRRAKVQDEERAKELGCKVSGITQAKIEFASVIDKPIAFRSTCSVLNSGKDLNYDSNTLANQYDRIKSILCQNQGSSTRTGNWWPWVDPRFAYLHEVSKAALYSLQSSSISGVHGEALMITPGKTFNVAPSTDTLSRSVYISDETSGSFCS